MIFYKKIVIGVLGALPTIVLGKVVIAASMTLEYPSFVSSPTPAAFVYNFYNYALGIAGTLAIIMIIYGGIKYIAMGGNSSAQTDAKDIIMSAIWGLLLLAGAFLVLNTINPTLTQIKNISSSYVPPATTGAPTGGPTGGPTGLGGLTESDARSQLLAAGINMKGICSPGQTSGCTTLAGLQQETINDLITLKQACGVIESGNCDVYITSGTDGAHNETGSCTHSLGCKADLRYNEGDSLTKYIESMTNIGKSSKGYDMYKDPTSGVVYMHETNPPHWDVTTKPSK
jgi:hypothetical protein